MTLGTGFVGRSAIGENLEPRHLVNWTRIAYNSDPGVPFGNFTAITPWRRPPERVPAYPIASNAPGGGGMGPRTASRGGSRGPAAAPAGPAPAAGQAALPDSVRAALRAMIIDELKNLVGE